MLAAAGARRARRRARPVAAAQADASGAPVTATAGAAAPGGAWRRDGPGAPARHEVLLVARADVTNVVDVMSPLAAPRQRAPVPD